MPRIFKTESRYIRSNFLCFQQAQQLQQARLAQSVARETLNLKVVGSSPTSGFSFCNAFGPGTVMEDLGGRVNLSSRDFQLVILFFVFALTGAYARVPRLLAEAFRLFLFIKPQLAGRMALAEGESDRGF
jgi:hypothetical protein